MNSIWTMGEILVEIMRPEPGIGLSVPGAFVGPFPSGAPAIFIDVAARLGVSTGIIGGVADDVFGDLVVDRLKRDRVETRYIERFAGTTAVAFVAYDDAGDRTFVYHIEGTPAVRARFSPPEPAFQPGFFHVMGCSLMANGQFRHEIMSAAAWFGAAGAQISFDPNIRQELLHGRALGDVVGEEFLSSCSVVLPGEAELAALAGTHDVGLGATRLIAEYGLEYVVVKHGKSGATVFNERQSVKIPAHRVTEVDPTGAGDAFDAGFLAGLVHGYSPETAAELAAWAGAQNAAAFGPMEGDIGIDRWAGDRES